MNRGTAPGAGPDDIPSRTIALAVFKPVQPGLTLPMATGFITDPESKGPTSRPASHGGGEQDLPAACRPARFRSAPGAVSAESMTIRPLPSATKSAELPNTTSYQMDAEPPEGKADDFRCRLVEQHPTSISDGPYGKAQKVPAWIQNAAR